MSDEKCSLCGMDKNIRNPSGYCDHLYFPEMVSFRNTFNAIRTQQKADIVKLIDKWWNEEATDNCTICHECMVADKI